MVFVNPISVIPKATALTRISISKVHVELSNVGWCIDKSAVNNRVQQIAYASTYLRLVKQFVRTFFFPRTLTYVKESSIAYTKSIMTKYL